MKRGQIGSDSGLHRPQRYARTDPYKHVPITDPGYDNMVNEWSLYALLVMLGVVAAIGTTLILLLF